MPNHPNKHIREAIKYAEDRGWRVVKAGGQAHIGATCIALRIGVAVVSFVFFQRLEFPRITRDIFATKLTIARIRR
jgi:hypothetical protein